MNTYTGQKEKIHICIAFDNWLNRHISHVLFLYLPSSKPLWWSFIGRVSFCWLVTPWFIEIPQKVGCFLHTASFLATNAMKPPQLVSLTRIFSKSLAYVLICGEVVTRFVAKSYHLWPSHTQADNLRRHHRVCICLGDWDVPLNVPVYYIMYYIMYCISQRVVEHEVCAVYTVELAMKVYLLGKIFFKNLWHFFPLTRRPFVKHPGVPNFL